MPEPVRLEALARSLATLDVVMCPDRQYRYFHYDPSWSPEDGDRLFSLENGSGDDFFLVFSPEGVFLKGFGHESYMTPWAEDPPRIMPGVLDSVPKVFDRFLNEPAFSMESTSFCIWHLAKGTTWQIGPVVFPSDEDDPDGSRDLLEMLDDRPETYRVFCMEYYEKDVPLEAIRAVYAGTELTPELAYRLSPEAVWANVAAEAMAIGYPTTSRL